MTIDSTGKSSSKDLEYTEEEMQRFDRVKAIKEIRRRLGYGLRESHDFYMLEPRNWVHRTQEREKTPMYQSVEEKIRKVVRDYYLALDRREHGGVAQDTALNAIQQILNMQWQQGAELAKHNA